MASASVSLQHVGVGCNRVVHALHWGETGLLAYAAHNSVVVYNTQEARVLGTLLGHTDCVNCVRWLSAADLGVSEPQRQHPPAAGTGPAPAALVSGSGDCSICIWLWTPHTPQRPWRLAARLEGHTAPLTSLATLPLPGGAGLLLVSTAGDGEVLVWECSSSTGSSSSTASCDATDGAADSHTGACSDGGTLAWSAMLAPSTWRLAQRIAVGHQLQGCATLAALPADPGWLLLALGGVDAAVRLYSRPPGPGTHFSLVCRLTGHQDWIKGLAFAQTDERKLLLASASQDKNVRVWAVALQQPEAQQQQQPSSSGSQGSDGTLDLSSLAQALTRYAPKPLIHTQHHTYSATLEALLIGHEDWVHSVAWHPPVRLPDGSTSQPACLLSASMDRTMMLWRPDQATGLWMSEESVGDAGANHLGYYTGVFSPDGAGIAAHGFTGALHIWQRSVEDGSWLPQHALGGHFGPVVDACWAADGSCLLTVSTDQTARITICLHDGHWCEIARPQVHGHDFSGVAALPSSTDDGSVSGASAAPRRRYLYASTSEEKVIRVFEAPRAFADTLAMARGQQPAAAGCGGGGRGALGALLPALGLSNKAVYQEESVEGEQSTAVPSSLGTMQNGGLAGTGAGAYTEGPDLAPHAAPSAVAGPPLEEHLAQNTLWPEIHKLYGHGNDVYCLAADPLGRYLASACRAQTTATATIWLWDTARWTGIGQLRAHTLTVTQLAFSPDGRFLASASRDRSLALFERQDQQQEQQQQRGGSGGAEPAPAAAAAAVAPFRLVGRIERAHTRILWGLHWSPDSRLLATASRDGKVKVWSVGAEGGSRLPAAPAAAVDCKDSVHSVQFAPACQPGTSYHLAAGLEGGAVQLLHLATEPAAGGHLAVRGQQRVWESPRWEQHAAAVRRLCWRRQGGGAGEQGSLQPEAPARYHLASCSDDHSLRIFSVTL